MTLNDKTTESIAHFTNNVRKYDIVEAVYYTCYQENNVIKIDVVAIFNNSLKYQENFEKELSNDDRQLLAQMIEDNNANAELIDNEIPIFRMQDSGDYNVSLMHYRERYAIKNLISGYITFDRFGKITELMKYMVTRFGIVPFNNSFVVENNSEILAEHINNHIPFNI